MSERKYLDRDTVFAGLIDYGLIQAADNPGVFYSYNDYDAIAKGWRYLIDQDMIITRWRFSRGDCYVFKFSNIVEVTLRFMTDGRSQPALWVMRQPRFGRLEVVPELGDPGSRNYPYSDWEDDGNGGYFPAKAGLIARFEKLFPGEHPVVIPWFGQPQYGTERPQS